MYELSLSSPKFDDGAEIPSKYTSDGENISPPLVIDGVGEEAKSLVLILDDPDAATDPDGPGATFDHWILFNIPPSVRVLDEGTTPDGAITGLNGMGEPKYIGPAPPNGTHRYIFTLYELSDNIEGIDHNATKDDILEAIKHSTLRKTRLLGTYQRKS